MYFYMHLSMVLERIFGSNIQEETRGGQNCNIILIYSNHMEENGVHKACSKHGKEEQIKHLVTRSELKRALGKLVFI
jgi:hypothetical protein